MRGSGYKFTDFGTFRGVFKHLYLVGIISPKRTMSEGVSNAQDGQPKSRGPPETEQSSSTALPVKSTEAGPADVRPDAVSAQSEEQPPGDGPTTASDQPVVPVGVPVALPVSMPVPTEQSAATDGSTADPAVDAPANAQHVTDTETDTASIVSDPMEAEIFDDEGYAESR